MPPCPLAVVLIGIACLMPGTANAQNPFASKMYIVKEYDGQQQISIGLMQTGPKNTITLHYLWNNNLPSTNRLISGEYRVTGQIFCYLFPQLGMTTERCGTFDGHFITFLNGYSMRYQKAPPLSVRTTERGKYPGRLNHQANPAFK